MTRQQRLLEERRNQKFKRPQLLAEKVERANSDYIRREMAYRALERATDTDSTK